MKINFKISKKHTSCTLRNELVALWLLMNDHVITKNGQSEEDKVIEFVYKCLESWRLNVAKGFSDHVYKCMWQDILERRDYLQFERILKRIS